MPNAGGNTTSSKRGLSNLQGSSQLSNGVKHLSTSEWLSYDTIDAEHAPINEIDVNYGLRLDGTIPENPSNDTAQGNGTTKMVDAGPGITNRGVGKVAGSRDPQPGGGF